MQASNIDINDPDAGLKLLAKLQQEQRINQQAKQKDYQTYVNNAFIECTKKVDPIVYNKNIKQKPKGYKDILKQVKRIITLSVIAGGMIIGGHLVTDGYKTQVNKVKINDALNDAVVENTTYRGSNPNDDNNPYWNVDYSSVAKAILYQNIEYDIDTRIYGTYKNLNDWQKERVMDEIFEKLREIVNTEGVSVSDDIYASCNHSTFKEYLNSKGLSEEGYTKLMEKIVTSYAKGEDVTGYLNQLNHEGEGR